MGTEIIEYVSRKPHTESYCEEVETIHFTRFWGGEKDKASLQITLHKEIATLNNKQVKELIKLLNTAFKN